MRPRTGREMLSCKNPRTLYRLSAARYTRVRGCYVAYPGSQPFSTMGVQPTPDGPRVFGTSVSATNNPNYAGQPLPHENPNPLMPHGEIAPSADVPLQLRPRPDGNDSHFPGGSACPL